MAIVTAASYVMTAYVLWLGSQGNLRTQTVKAFTEDEYRSIVGQLA